MRINHVLIDYENVQPEALSMLDAEHFKVLVFVGANQTKLRFETALALQRMGSKAEYIKVSGNGSNALDFHIAFYIGQLAGRDPDAYFHIISKDTGFDPLIEHLKAKKILAARSCDICELPLLKMPNAKAPADRIAAIIADLQRRGSSRPKTTKTLLNTMGSLFQKQLGEAELAALLARLQAQSYISITDETVSYALPAAEA